MSDEPAIRRDLLFTLLARRAISRHEFLAGREWQYYLEAIQIQRPICYDWDVPIFMQTNYQSDGGLRESQEDAYDTRKIIRDEIGRTAFDDLDRLLSVPENVTVRLSEAGMAYVSRLLRVISVILDIQAGGTEFGAEQEEWEMSEREARERLLRKEQPWLFDHHKRQDGHKPSASQIRAR